MMNQQGIPPPRWKQLHQKSNDILQQLRLSTPQLLKQSSRKSSLQLNTKQEQVSAAIEQQKMILAIAALQDEKNRLVREKEENEKLCRGSEEKRNGIKLSHVGTLVTNHAELIRDEEKAQEGYDAYQSLS